MKSLSFWPPPRRWALAGLALGLIASPVLAQSRLVAEYRIDGGPSQSMTLASTNSRPEYWEGEFTASLSTAHLSVGPHLLEVRAQGTNGVWCAWQSQWFRITGDTHLVAAEWFIDTDPGEGQATPIPLPADGAWDEPDEDLVVSGLTVNNLSLGRHRFITRAKDSNGDWGVTSEATFYVAPEITITKAVWTTNVLDWGDPSVVPPATNVMRITTNAPNGDAEAQASFNTLALGTNYCLHRTIYVRVQDSWGRWSTRHALVWDASGQTWRFEPKLDWARAQVPLIVEPEVASTPAPGDHNLFVNTANSVTLDWKDCKGVSGYEVWFRPERTVPFTPLASGFTNSTLTINSLSVTGACQWMVRSLGDPGCWLDSPVWQFGITPPLSVSVDADKDGIPDACERYYFGSLNAVNGTTDRDGDGARDWEEWAANTVPTNRLDFLKIDECRTGPFNGWIGMPAAVIDWQAKAGPVYSVFYATNLLDFGTVWTFLDVVPGVDGLMSYTNHWPDPMGFYLLEATRP